MIIISSHHSLFKCTGQMWKSIIYLFDSFFSSPAVCDYQIHGPPVENHCCLDNDFMNVCSVSPFAKYLCFSSVNQIASRAECFHGFWISAGINGPSSGPSLWDSLFPNWTGSSSAV